MTTDQQHAFSDFDLEVRKTWIEDIVGVTGSFADNAIKLRERLSEETDKYGLNYLLSHLRLSGALPESYDHDSTEEKQYSKYTDSLLSVALDRIGLKSMVITERGDVADVEAVADNFDMVADAKAFSLSRTAKIQKDFKVEAMHRWKHGKQYAMVVCPIYQLPSKSSQIYDQAIARSVLIFTFTHLSILVRYAQEAGPSACVDILQEFFECTKALNPTKEAYPYWQCINELLLNRGLKDIWADERQWVKPTIEVLKEEALTYLSAERSRLLSLSRDEAVQELMQNHRLVGRVRSINNVSDNGLLSFV